MSGIAGVAEIVGNGSVCVGAVSVGVVSVGSVSVGAVSVGSVKPVSRPASCLASESLLILSAPVLLFAHDAKDISIAAVKITEISLIDLFILPPPDIRIILAVG